MSRNIMDKDGITVTKYCGKGYTAKYQVTKHNDNGEIGWVQVTQKELEKIIGAIQRDGEPYEGTCYMCNEWKELNEDNGLCEDCIENCRKKKMEHDKKMIEDQKCPECGSELVECNHCRKYTCIHCGWSDNE